MIKIIIAVILILIGFAISANAENSIVPPKTKVAKQENYILLPNTLTLEQNDTLKSIGHVSVHVFLVPEIEEFGLQRLSMQTAVELRLRSLGIIVDEIGMYRAVSVKSTESYGYLDIVVGGIKQNDGIIFNIIVALKQYVVTANTPNLALLGTTWITSSFGKINDSNKLKTHLIDKVDEFANAYLANHPKETKPIDSAPVKPIEPETPKN